MGKCHDNRQSFMGLQKRRKIIRLHDPKGISEASDPDCELRWKYIGMDIKIPLSKILQAMILSKL